MNDTEHLTQQPMDMDDSPAIAPSSRSLTNTSLIPQSGSETCATCGGGSSNAAPPSYVYAMGKIEWRFPKQSVEKEFAQATGRTETAGQTDREAVHTVLTQRQNRYLVRQLCWVLTIEGLETYILVPRDPADLDLLVEAVRPAPSPLDIDIIIGMRGPIAPPELCNGLMLPIVVFDQIYSFDRSALIQNIPRPETIPATQFTQTCEELLDRITQLAYNARTADEDHALKYFVESYHPLYAKAAEAYGQSCSLTGMEVRPSSLSNTRKIVDVIFSFTNRNTDFTEKFFVRVDVSDEFPFLVTKLSPYYDR